MVEPINCESLDQMVLLSVKRVWWRISKIMKAAVGPTVSAGFQTVVQIKSGAIKSTMNGLVMDIAEGNTKVSAYV